MAELSWLVERARTGDLDAFGEVVRRFQDMAHGYAYAILGDFHLAEDVAQEAFVDAYYKLEALREPAAFPGWFRRIVFKHCDRVTRRRKVATVALEEGLHIPESPAARSELQEDVLRAIRSLPDRQREATTLYYIDGYSQEEIADFLEVPLTTVRKRLHDSRKALRERMTGMVKETLRENAPDERFSQDIIAALRSRPDLLQVTGHPVKDVLDAILAALPEYEYLQGDEIIATQDEAGVYPVEIPEAAYRVDADHVLRTSTTPTVMRAAAKRQPPVLLTTAGRAFRSGPVDGHPLRANVFHMVDVLGIDAGITLDGMKRVLAMAVSSALGVTNIRFMQREPFQGCEDCVVAQVDHSGAQLEVGAGGVITSETLTKAGFDPDRVSGFCFGLGLERLAMIKLGLNNIHALWQPPYVPPAGWDRTL